jgi:FkbM family methyltransferase
MLKKIRQFYPLNRSIAFFIKLHIRIANWFLMVFSKHWPITGTIKVKLSNEKSFKWYSKGDDYISGKMFWTSILDYEKSAKVWIELAKEASVIVDAGANTGVYSVMASTMNENAKIFSFEPVPQIAERFRKQLKINNFSNIVIEEKLLSEKDDLMKFYIPSETKIPLASSVEKNWVTHTNETEIEAVCLDSYFNKIGLIPDLVKIDCEFHELEILQGMSNILDKKRTIAFIEVLLPEMDEVKGHFVNNKHIELEKYLRKKDYHIYIIYHNALIYSEKFVLNPEDRNYLLLPFKTETSFNLVNEIIDQWQNYISTC